MVKVMHWRGVKEAEEFRRGGVEPSASLLLKNQFSIPGA